VAKVVLCVLILCSPPLWCASHRGDRSSGGGGPTPGARWRFGAVQLRGSSVPSGSCSPPATAADPAQRVLALRRAGEMRRHRGGSEPDPFEEEDLEPGANSGSGATALQRYGGVADDAGMAERGIARQDSGAGAGIDKRSDARRNAGEAEGGSHTVEAAVAREGGDTAEKAEEDENAENDPMLVCWECGEDPTVECAMCGRARYCGVECQKAHWEWHRNACRSLRPPDRVEGPNPPRADWENVAYQYQAGNQDYIDLVDQVSAGRLQPLFRW